MIAKPSGNEHGMIRYLIGSRKQGVHFSGLFSDIIVVDPMEAWHMPVYFPISQHVLDAECRLLT